MHPLFLQSVSMNLKHICIGCCVTFTLQMRLPTRERNEGDMYICEIIMGLSIRVTVAPV